MTATITEADLAALDLSTGELPAAPGLASLSFDLIPSEARVWLVPGILAEGEVTVDAGVGETAKSLRNLMFAVRAVLGVAQPGEDHETTREPARALWITSGTEDDPMRDLAPRFAVAIAACAAEFGLDPEQARSALRYVHNLSEWAEGGPVHITEAGLADIRAEVDALNQLDADNRPPDHPEYAGPGPQVRLIVFDPLDALLGPDQTINTRTGARLVMTGLSRFARGTGAAVSVIHHVIASGNKIAGSPAVTNSVRLAFISAPDKANKQVICMRKVKANIAAPADVRYVVATLPADAAEAAGVAASAFVAFLGDQAAARGAGDTLRERVTAAHQSDPGSLRARVRAAAGQLAEPGQDAEVPAGGPQDAPGGPVRLLRRELPPGGEVGPMVVVGRSWPTAQAARDQAARDAGQVLTWKTGSAGRETAAVKLPTGAVLGYTIVPGAARA